MEYAKGRGLSSNSLKIIAVFSMLIDHIAAVTLVAIKFDFKAWGKLSDYFSIDAWWDLYYTLRLVGRFAFPVFVFLLVEGFLHTGNRKKYAFRLLLFAIISEIPFDLAFYQVPIYFGHQNIYFTLFIGLVVMICLERFHSSPIKQMAAIAAGCLAAFLLHTDYDMGGVLMIAAIYLLHKDRGIMMAAGAALAFLNNSGIFIIMGLGAALAFVPIWFYNGTRGKWNLKYFFYWFYPVHLMVLYLSAKIFLL